MEPTTVEELQSAGYSVPPSCNLCEYSCFGSNDRGLCRDLGVVIHKSGTCINFLASETQLRKLAFFREFTEFPS